ncbi:unnamed protein product [Moneuplotes crassus]|uniref:Uncharacterized protein n=1 Tax=Euplotes crassus TaxID=5936 RepID=A0AAD1U641_EUPCR|nr:unnamed protein product [Moneuplotes crassus]
MQPRSSSSQLKQETPKPYLANPIRKQEYSRIVNSKGSTIKRKKQYSLERGKSTVSLDNFNNTSSGQTNSQHATSTARTRQKLSSNKILAFKQEIVVESSKKEKASSVSKLSILENIGNFEKENRTLFKSNILSIRSMLENELTLDISLINEYGEDSELPHKGSTKEEEIKKFLRDSSIPIEKLQSRLNSITKYSKDSQIICQEMGCKTKDDALRILYETTKYIEVLWNQMIALETAMIYKYNNKVQSNHFSKTMMSEIDNSFKGFESFFRNRTLSYKNIMEKISKIFEGDLPSKCLTDANNISKSINKLKSISDIGQSSFASSLMDKEEFSRSSCVLLANKISNGAESYRPKLEPLSSSAVEKLNPLKNAKKIAFRNKSFKSIKKEMDDCKGSVCTNEFINSILKYVESNFRAIPDMKESMKDKQEECDILRSRCDLLQKHVEESENLSKHLTKEVERYQILCEENMNKDKNNEFEKEIFKPQTNKSSPTKIKTNRYTTSSKEFQDLKLKKSQVSRLGKPIKLKLKNK